MRFLPLFFLGILWIGSLEATPWQPFTALALSPDGRSLATGGLGGEVLWWEAETGEVMGRWEISEALPVTGLCFDADSRTLGIALLDGRVLMAITSQTEPQPLVLSDMRRSLLATATARWLAQGSPMSGTMEAFGSLSAQGYPDGRIEIHDTLGPNVIRSWAGHQAAVTGLVWSPDGQLLYSCGFDGTLACWEIATGKLVRRL